MRSLNLLNKYLFFQFYHLCDNNGKFQYCISRFDVLQFCDFYSAIMTMWATAVLMSDLSFQWRSALHLTGSLIFAGLLQTKTTGFWSFVVPGFSSITLLSLSWVRDYYLSKYFINLKIFSSNSFITIKIHATNYHKYIKYFI